MISKGYRLVTIFGVLFAVAGIVNAGVNMWTGGRPADKRDNT
jgi:hypothetical protein